ncbi:MAG: hypothetical protein ACYSVY_29685 [Planctomycetota bacterium]|jgi:hypothetical protein
MSRPAGRRSLIAATALAILLLSLGLPAATAAQEISQDLYQQLRYRHIGPVGNRVSTVVGVPGDPMTYYAGAASGGV